MSRIHGPSVGARRRQNVGFLSGPLPYGSLKRKIILWGIVPLAILLVLYVIVDDVVMPTVTRHGEEFTLPDVTEQDMVEALTDADARVEAIEIYVSRLRDRWARLSASSP